MTSKYYINIRLTCILYNLIEKICNIVVQVELYSKIFINNK